MVTRTRRALLQGAAALSLGLAGCSGASSSGSTATASNRLEGENVVRDPESVALRNPDNTWAAWRTDEAPIATASTADGDRRIADAEEGLIADAETAADLRFADVDGVDAARTFVDGTDFATETLVLDTSRVPECYRLDLCGVTWSATDYHTYYGRVLRPVDVACRTDTWDRITHLIRIPAVLDPTEIRGRGRGTAGDGCSGFRERAGAGGDR